MSTIIGWIATPLGMLLSGIYSVIGNYGITLIIFTIIVRLCLFPLYANQIKHTAKMGDVQPKMQEIQKKYANDKEEMNKKMMELYQQENFNPMRGCLPMLIQFPIIIGLFSLLRNPMKYMENSPEMIMAVHEKFLWINDLAQPDVWILPIMAGITTFISFTVTQAQNPTNQANNQMAGMMKMMKYFFPVMIVWMGRSFPAGLTLYWFTGNLFTVLQSKVLNVWKKKLMSAKEKDKQNSKK